MREAPSAMRARARSIAPFRRCGPGTSTMHGQTATRRSTELSWSRAAIAPTAPASNAAQKGCTKGLRLISASHRRRQAPARDGIGRNHLAGDQILADAEVLERALGLGPPELVGRNVDLAETVGFRTNVTHRISPDVF